MYKHMILIEATHDETAAAPTEEVTRLVAARGAASPQVKGLVVSTVLEPLTGASRALAMVQLWSPEGGTTGADLVDSWLDGLDVLTSSWLVEEIVFRQPVDRQEVAVNTERVNMLGTGFRRDDFTIEAFFDYWITTHAPISGAVPGSVGYVVSRVRDAGGKRADDGVDAFIELWYPDRDVFDRAGTTPEQDAAWADVANYAKTDGEFWLTREHVVVAPAATGPGLLEVSG